MEDLQGNQDSFVLLAIGSSFKKHDIAILRRHSNGRLFFFSAWKQNGFLSNSSDFQSSDQRTGCQCEGGGWQEVLKSTAQFQHSYTSHYFASLFCSLFSQTVTETKRLHDDAGSGLSAKSQCTDC